MSIESFQSFLTRISEDEQLRDELRAREPEGMTAEQLAHAAAERGFEFTAKEVDAAVATVGLTDDELSDTQLEGVAGGATFNSLTSFKTYPKVESALTAYKVYSIWKW
jgi:predicted ribosomally synthesized peptide with nif11-like leader